MRWCLKQKLQKPDSACQRNISIWEQSKGYVQCDAKKDNGSTFQVWLKQIKNRLKADLYSTGMGIYFSFVPLI